jgi:hypothetical protein
MPAFMTRFSANRRSQMHVAVVAIVATVAWIGVVALIADEHGSHRRSTFDGVSR